MHAASKGNLYRYTVDKFWVVESSNEDGRVLLRTRRGKRHTADPNDPQLRKARFWERWLYRDRFEMAQSCAETDSESDETSDAYSPVDGELAADSTSVPNGPKQDGSSN
ncbi:hypothetical protein RMSM_01799 [Rhodopirellula maiorica SM1]|uniref:Uncharacterized protein n=1 Tax=Rhodopirellula maiorica SM1 TaxID=1265738 RepID=M5RPK2_9BACT|nr:hypothetical protein RMSM_01799 [Rhodopirellula maiorica SM1]